MQSLNSCLVNKYPTACGVRGYDPDNAWSNKGLLLTLTARGSTLDARIWRLNPLTSKVDPGAVRVKIFIMVVEPQHRCMCKWGVKSKLRHDDFQLKKTFWSPWLIQKYVIAVRVDIHITSFERIVAYTLFHHLLGVAFFYLNFYFFRCDSQYLRGII